MNHTRLPKEVLLTDWARRDKQVEKSWSCIVCKCKSDTAGRGEIVYFSYHEACMMIAIVVDTCSHDERLK